MWSTLVKANGDDRVQKIIIKSFSIVAILLLAFVARLHHFAVLGMQADEGVAITAANQLNAGDVLYTDLFWNHNPGVPLTIALAFSLAGGAVAVPRLLSIFAAVATTVCLFAIVRGIYSADGWRIRDPRLGAAAAALFFALAPLPIFWSRLTALESFETAFAAMSILCAIAAMKRRCWIWWFATGIAAGLGVLAKVSGLVPILAVGLSLAGWWLIKRDWYPFRMGLVVLLGIGAVWLPMVLLFLWQGNLADFLDLASGAERLAPLLDWQGKVSNLIAWSLKRPAMVLAVVGSYWAFTSRRSEAWLVLVWFTLEGFFLFLAPNIEFGWGGFSHYTLPLIAASSILAGIGLAQLSGILVRGTVRRQRIAAGATLVLLLLMLPAQTADMKYAVFDTTYPTPSQSQEREIGQVIAASVPPDSPMLVFGNAAFYFWADRPPASRFFHYPSYLKSSDLREESDAALVAALATHAPHMIVRADARQYVLSDVVLEAIDRYWTEVTVLPYDYENQGPVTLLVPRREKDPSPALATYDSNIRLHAIDAVWLPSSRLLVQLRWSTGRPIPEDYTVFVHLVDRDGCLVGQDDSMPVHGGHLTSAWSVDEPVDDFHYVPVPDEFAGGNYEVRVGLYLFSTGERLSIVETGESYFPYALGAPLKKTEMCR